MSTFRWIAVVLVLCLQSTFARSTQPAGNASTLFLQAAKLVRANDALQIMSPSASSMGTPDGPPYPAEWQQMEKTSFAANAPARALAHQARSFGQASWPKIVNFSSPAARDLNECRNLDNELADAALYQHFQHDDTAAIETVRDMLHLANTLENQPDKQFSYLLVSTGIQAVCAHDLDVISSTVSLTKDSQDTKSLQTAVAHDLIAYLLNHPDAKTEASDYLRAESASSHDMKQIYMDRAIEIENRCNIERDMAAISLACHLYRFDTNRWPATLNDLRSYLPILPIDPFGDGKQTIGYALIQSGLPDGSDRPMVYSHFHAAAGLFFRTDRPTYSYYSDDGSGRPHARQKDGGQFRDVASWVPPAGNPALPTTRPLP